MNEVDRASELEQAERDANIAAARSSKSVSPKPTGRCVWCGEDISPDSANPRFCDARHRDMYDNYRARHPELNW
jgi:hypothetical protein